MSFSHRRRSPRVRGEQATPLEGRSLVKLRSSTFSLMTTTRSWGGRNTTSQSRRGKPAGAEFQLVPPNSTAPPPLQNISPPSPYAHAHRSTASTDDEMDDQQVQKLLIVTQTSTTVVSAAYKKHPGGDRTGNFVTRSKMDSDLAQAINDGLYFYEQVLYIIHMYTVLKAGHPGVPWLHMVLYGILFFTYMYMS